jgi:hypothetical protein
MLKKGSIEEALDVAKQVIKIINPNLGESETVLSEVRRSLQDHLDKELHAKFPELSAKGLRGDNDALEEIQKYANRGADINWINPHENSQSVIHLAARSMKMASNVQLIDALIKAGGDFSIQVSCFTLGNIHNERQCKSFLFRMTRNAALSL